MYLCTYLLTSLLPTYLLLNASIGGKKKKDLATNQAKIHGFSELHLGFLILFPLVSYLSHLMALFLLLYN